MRGLFRYSGSFFTYSEFCQEISIEVQLGTTGSLDCQVSRSQKFRLSALQTKTPQAGDIKFKDVNGDGVVDSKDRTFIGSITQ
jgi:hypothetical protein